MRLMEEDLSDGNLSISLAVDEFPENRHRRTEQFLEKMAKKPVPDEIYVLDDVLALLDDSNEEQDGQQDEAPALSSSLRPPTMDNIPPLVSLSLDSDTSGHLGNN